MDFETLSQAFIDRFGKPDPPTQTFTETSTETPLADKQTAAGPNHATPPHPSGQADEDMRLLAAAFGPAETESDTESEPEQAVEQVPDKTDEADWLMTSYLNPTQVAFEQLRTQLKPSVLPQALLQSEALNPDGVSVFDMDASARQRYLDQLQQQGAVNKALLVQTALQFQQQQAGQQALLSSGLTDIEQAYNASRHNMEWQLVRDWVEKRFPTITEAQLKSAAETLHRQLKTNPDQLGNVANLGGKIALSVRLLDNLGYLPKTGSTHGNGPAAMTEAMAPDAGVPARRVQHQATGRTGRGLTVEDLAAMDKRAFNEIPDEEISAILGRAIFE